MKKLFSLVLVLILCVSATFALVACQGTNKPITDYVAMHTLDVNSSTAKVAATVKTYIDGDTTHFNVPAELAATFEDSVLKARYLGIDTPESTGVIQEYGKQASNFTHDALASVDPTDSEAIILESDTATWNKDGNGRGLVWVWYRKTADSKYRLLNLELLQNGLAYGKSLEDVRYMDICDKAYAQAMKRKIKIFSDEPDPLFYYNDAVQVDLKYLRTHTKDLAGKKVAFTATIAKRYSNSLYVQSWNEEDQMYYGMVIFYGYTCDFTYMLNIGTEMYFVADATDSESFGFQVSNIKYDPYIDDPELVKNYVRLIDSNKDVVYPLTDVETFNGKKTIKVYADADDETGEEKQFDYAALVLNAPIAFEDLYVYDVYTTKKEGTSKGAMTLYCRDSNNKEVVIRTLVLYEGDKAASDGSNIKVAADYLNKTINVRGIVDWYKPDGGVGQYQIEVSSVYDITVK